MAIGWTVIALAIIPFGEQAAERLQVGIAGIQGSEAALVDQLLTTEFRSPFSSQVLLIVTEVPPPTDAAGRKALRAIVAGIEEVRGVTRTLSYADVQDSRLMSDAGTLVIVGLDLGAHRPDQVIADLRQASAALRAMLRNAYSDAELLWTGREVFDHDFRRISAADVETAERRVLPLSLVLLLIAFGSLVAALLPIVVGVLAIGLALGLAVLLATHVPLTVLLQNIVSMLGLGLGIDYSLLMVGRFREALKASGNAKQAATDAVRHAGHTILVSGSAVAVGFAALAFMPVSELRSLAIGGCIVTAFSMLLALTLLPPILSWMGPHVNFGRIPGHRRISSAATAWRSWAVWVAAHPVLTLVIAGAPLVALAWQTTRMSTSIPSGDLLPGAIESQRGLDALRRMGQSGLLQTVRVVVHLPAGKDISTAEGWRHVLRWSRELQADPRIAYVHSLPVAVKRESITADELTAIPPDLLRSLVSADYRYALIEAVPREGVTLVSMIGLVRELRRVKPVEGELQPVAVYIGGLPAFNADYENAVAGNLALIVALVIGGTFAALIMGFHSLLIATKAVALNLLTVTAAMGVVVLVFQDGHAIGLVGLTNAIDGLFPAVPVIVFCTLFGLSMDYEIFIVSRVKEYVDAGLSDVEALVEGLARTAGIITSAASVMIVVFAAFALADFLVIKILGLCLAVAVAIDATVVRMALGPALLRLGGRWNWWPGRGVR
jgi:putative drug exporter of the RND superfamily